MRIFISQCDGDNHENRDKNHDYNDVCSTGRHIMFCDPFCVMQINMVIVIVIVRFAKCSATRQILPTTNCCPVCIHLLCGLSQILDIFGNKSSMYLVTNPVYFVTNSWYSVCSLVWARMEEQTSGTIVTKKFKWSSKRGQEGPSYCPKYSKLSYYHFGGRLEQSHPIHVLRAVWIFYYNGVGGLLLHPGSD